MGALEELKNKLSEKFGDKIKLSEDKRGVLWIECDVSDFKEILAFLCELGYSHLSTITALDHLEENKFALIYHILSFENHPKIPICLRTYINRDSPEIETVLDIYPHALVYEREVFDLMGIKFKGHKGLKRLLIPEDAPEDYHPLRKDYKIEVGD